MQVSHVHTRQCTEWMMKRQATYAAKRGAAVGVLPELFCFQRGEVLADPAAAATYSAAVLDVMLATAKEAAIHLCFSLVERDADGKLYHTAYLVGPEGTEVGKYRKAHLSSAERAWGATPGPALAEVLTVPALGRVALMIE